MRLRMARAKAGAVAMAVMTTGSMARAEAPPIEPPRRLAVVTDEPEPMTHASALIDVAFIPLGKIGGRFEVAVTGMHALYVEPSYIVRHIPQLDRSISAMEVDVGWHLFPKGRGLRGFHFGPRAVFAATSVEEARARAWAFGADVGYQWVIAGGPTLNLGVGIAYYHVTARARPEAISIFPLLEPKFQKAISNASIHAHGLMPLGMAGMGFSY